MTGRAKWDDFNNSSHDDEEVNEKRNLDHSRLYITNIPRALNEDGLRAAFEKYGTLTEVFMSKDPQKKYAIVRYEAASEAKLAVMKMNRTEPLKLSISIAYKPRKYDRKENRHNEAKYDHYEENRRDDNASVSSRGRNTRRDGINNSDNLAEDDQPMEDQVPTKALDPSLHIQFENMKLEKLKLLEEQLECRHRILVIQQAELAEKRQMAQSTPANRCILADGRIVVRNVSDRLSAAREDDAGYAAGAGDSTENTLYSCKTKTKLSWQCCETNDSSTSSTCTLCSENQSDMKDKKSELTSKVSTTYSSKIIDSKVTRSSKYVVETLSKTSDVNSKTDDVKRDESDGTCELKFSDFNTDPDDEDETNRIIQLRNADYMDIVDDNLKLVIALEGYPKSKMRLQQMQLFQKCLTDIIEMQLKNGLLRKVPNFLDYYLNRGAIVCICKDDETRNWMVRISPGLQERMGSNLILLKADLKRLCLAVLKIPRRSWPATAQDTFKLLQYFNPTLNTNLWKIYAQKFVDDVECTYFLIDRVSGEIIRGSAFKNVIDYSQMELKLAGYTEIYYECLLSSMQEDLRSVTSRVKLLEEIKSGEPTPRNLSDISNVKADNVTKVEKSVATDNENNDSECLANLTESYVVKEADVEKEMENSFKENILMKLKDVQYISDKEEVLVWSGETKIFTSDNEIERTDQINCDDNYILEDNKKLIPTSDITVSDNIPMAESLGESKNSIAKSSNFNIDSNRGIAYYRRTNYLHVENELKVAITLEGYPQNKLDGTHIRRLKHLFKEYLHKDIKMKLFANLITPKFQDVYLSNGAIIYVCDSMETKDYLIDIVPKLISSTGLKLTFRDLNSLVRYTRVVMRLPAEYAHVESADLLLSLQSQYPGLKPDCWKHYSDVAGKQKREFGVDPVSLEVIKNPNFNPFYEREILTFRIIDRQKRDVSFEDSIPIEDVKDAESEQRRENVVKAMYIPIDLQVIKAPLTKIRTNHYLDLIADDVKLYVGPSDYPETRIDEVLFHTIKRTFENIVCDCLDNGDFDEEHIPQFYDMYLFDGVIFIISKDMPSRLWVEKVLSNVNNKLNLQLKSTEFRGAVGIVSMIIKTGKRTDEVIRILQEQNPRLRTRFWRQISIVKTETKSDVVLQIDKVSAEVITSPKFNKFVDGDPVEFKLGHLRSLLKPKASLEELSKANVKKLERKSKKTGKKNKMVTKSNDGTNLETKNEQADTTIESKVTKSMDTNKSKELPGVSSIKMNLEIPLNILPDHEDDLNIIFELLENKNPGLNTESWEIYNESLYPGDGKFILYVDKQSVFVIESKNFDPTIGGEILRFSF